MKIVSHETTIKDLIALLLLSEALLTRRAGTRAFSNNRKQALSGIVTDCSELFASRGCLIRAARIKTSSPGPPPRELACFYREFPLLTIRVSRCELQTRRRSWPWPWLRRISWGRCGAWRWCRCSSGGRYWRWAGATTSRDIDLHRVRYVRARFAVAAHRYRCVTHMRGRRVRARVVQARPAAPGVSSRVVQLEGVCGIRVEQPVEPRS
jgi:hypothetical protein